METTNTSPALKQTGSFAQLLRPVVLRSPSSLPALKQTGTADRSTRTQPNVKVRLLITIPTVLVLFTWAAGLLAMNLTKIAFLRQIGKPLLQTQAKAILPVEVWVVLFGVIAGVCGLLLAYGITKPLKKLYSQSEDLLRKYPPLHPSPITAPNEVVAASAFLEHTFNALNQVIQDHYVLDALPEGILSLDAQGKILSLNKVAGETLGVVPSEYLGKSYQELFPPTRDNETLFFLIGQLLGDERKESILAPVFCTTVGSKKGVFWLKLSLPPSQSDGEGGIITVKNLKEIEQIRMSKLWDRRASSGKQKMEGRVPTERRVRSEEATREKVPVRENELERLVKIASRVDEAEKATQKPGIRNPNRLDKGKNLTAEGDTSPLVRIVDLLIGEAIEKRASDIHIEPQVDGVQVRNRIDGILRNTHILPDSLHAPLVSRIKIMANMDIAEKRLPQDGRIKASFSNRKVDLRISSVPTLHGEKVALRLLDVEATSIPLQGIGFNQEIYEPIVSQIEKPQGVIFITGPTGSGKTSTLYACINHIKSDETNIVTLEDPIEYEMQGVNQIAINERIGLTFAEVLRSVLRQDPDVIMVGEMRDAETARIAMQASLTGHLVFSTLHTNDSVSAVVRLLDMGIAPYLIASSLNAVLAQRLVRVICPQCKETYRPSADELMRLGITDVNFSHLYRGKGCDRCDFTGFYGRTAVAELFIMDDEIRVLINSNAPESSIRDKARANGLQSLFQDALRKIQEGKTTINEVLSRIRHENAFE